MGMDSSRHAWRKASRSNESGGAECVEIAQRGDRIAVRDSKNPADHLTFARTTWRTFTSAIKAGHHAR
jgi:hypothetical protein